ncbi:lactate racemase domain-containing protein [Desulfosporosinus sp. BICA1-9]|uniref:lactate racemase domain-containing protein n=1 Tax=Desulfosporosinus sp. BICA1-9 TaxID=1531958 RepID=UPI0005F0EF0C|nr:lactate racemase domain-containing protein [Desulfosporosinus sp. BICA1-9]KJS50550.1 MAG: hypothetical protein VR66_01965 [Peptococcaceae bacterium BRH_c23]KJS82817.1 MAG: hypothetical protein JL57_23610 [Desulfosporosinus sp. BICA1-9]
MGILQELLADIQIPEMLKVKFQFPCNQLKDIEKVVINELSRENTLSSIKQGDTVAIAIGSREIANLALIIRTMTNCIKEKGGKPFIVPAMGSHGGATGQGQQEVLATFGVTEENIGVPIKSSMETTQIGITETGIPVYMDNYAFEADCLIPVGRIKPHTDFRGPYESGLMKMIAIGLGKQKGASICHQLGLPKMSKNVYDMAKVSLEKTNIIFGLGIIENAFHGTYKIVAIPAEEIEAEEPKLLCEAKALIPAIPFERVDVILVEEMGKDISGTGMDSNVIGRSSTLGFWKPNAERIVVLDLTDKSHHNANGFGLADITCRKMFDKMDFDQTYPNAITSSETNAVKIPIVMPSDETAIKCAIKTCTQIEKGGVKMVWIKNTLSLNEFYISEALKDEALKNDKLDLCGIAIKLNFSKNGDLLNLQRSKGNRIMGRLV